MLCCIAPGFPPSRVVGPTFCPICYHICGLGGHCTAAKGMIRNVSHPCVSCCKSSHGTTSTPQARQSNGCTGGTPVLTLEAILPRRFLLKHDFPCQRQPVAWCGRFRGPLPPCLGFSRILDETIILALSRSALLQLVLSGRVRQLPRMTMTRSSQTARVPSRARRKTATYQVLG